MTATSWKQSAYPLKQIEIKLQGTRHSSVNEMIDLLDVIKDKLLHGELSGHEDDDDFGYQFEVKLEVTDKPIFNHV